jgi:hypothetical protein
MVLADQLSEEDGQKVDWRDLLGDAKNFDPAVYGESAEEPKKSSAAAEDDAIPEGETGNAKAE